MLGVRVRPHRPDSLTVVSPPPEAARYLRESRLSPGRQAFERWLTEQVEAETHTALYSREPMGREIAAGRAQAWRELKILFEKS